MTAAPNSDPSMRVSASSAVAAATAAKPSLLKNRSSPILIPSSSSTMSIPRSLAVMSFLLAALGRGQKDTEDRSARALWIVLRGYPSASRGHDAVDHR